MLGVEGLSALGPRPSALAMRKAIFVFIATLAGGIVVADFADAQGC